MFYKIFNQKMTSTESNYIGSAIKGNTLTMMSKGFKGEFYDRQVKYANKMQSGLATAVTVTEAQLNFLLKDVQFMGILAKVNALSELDSKSEITKDEPEFVCSDNMGNPLHVGDKPVVSTAAFVFAFRMPPALDVGFVYIGNTASAPIKWYFS